MEPFKIRKHTDIKKNQPKYGRILHTYQRNIHQEDTGILNTDAPNTWVHVCKRNTTTAQIICEPHTDSGRDQDPTLTNNQ